jgi:hypothetical protein
MVLFQIQRTGYGNHYKDQRKPYFMKKMHGLKNGCIRIRLEMILPWISIILQEQTR